MVNHLLIQIFLYYLELVSALHMLLKVHLPFWTVQSDVLHLRFHHKHALVVLEVKVVVNHMSLQPRLGHLSR